MWKSLDFLFRLIVTKILLQLLSIFFNDASQEQNYSWNGTFVVAGVFYLEGVGADI